MFTGIIQGQGEIVGLRRSGQECRMEVRPLFPLENIVDGESIAHNGACLSVERHSGSTFTVYASGESLSRTTLGDLRKGDLVNLERALALGDRLGGHLVSGHVDCVATQKRTTMLHWRPGSRVNMETDLIGKYVRRIMQCQADGPATPQKSSGINKEFLLQNGFL